MRVRKQLQKEISELKNYLVDQQEGYSENPTRKNKECIDQTIDMIEMKEEDYEQSR